MSIENDYGKAMIALYDARDYSGKVQKWAAGWGTLEAANTKRIMKARRLLNDAIAEMKAVAKDWTGGGIR